jgi:hypothetical protein
VRSDIEQQGPGVITELVERVLALDLPQDLRDRINALAPALRETYEEAIAEIFDRHAQEGGVWVED